MTKAQVPLQWTTQDIFQIVFDEDHQVCYKWTQLPKNVEIVLKASPYLFFVGFFYPSSPSFCYIVHSCSKAFDDCPLNVFVM